jgi:eukaryotic-like serine/threonine-protein kinase
MHTDSMYCASCGAAHEDGTPLCHACRHPVNALSNHTILLGSRYRLLTQIGAGGFGAVYLATDSQNPDARIAIKQINLHGLSARQVIEATATFERERAILARLNHPQLPRMYATFEDTEHWYLVMDFFAGETLEQYLLLTRAQSSHGDRLNERIEDALCLGLQLCQVLDYLHTRIPPIIFRDLKPSNIIRQGQHSYKLVDFGIARSFKPAQVSDTIPFGSPGYAAPEQYGRAQTDPRADIYSLGAILHQVLSAHDPTDHPLHFAPLSFTDPTLKRLASLIMTMVALQAERRPASIREIARELRVIQQERQATDARIWVPGPGLPPPQPTGMAPPQPLSRTSKPQPAPKTLNRRSVLIGGLKAGAAVVLLGVGGVYSRQTHRTLSHRSPSHPLDLCFTGVTINQISWSPESSYLALSMNDDMNDAVCIWHLHSQKPVWTLPTKAWNTAVAWSPDGRYLALNDGAEIQLLQRGTWQHLLSWKDPENTYSGIYLAWSPNGKYLAEANYGGHIKIWNPLVGKRLHSYVQISTDYWFAWSPDSSLLATGGNEISLWDVRTGRRLFQRNYHSPSDLVSPIVAWSRDSKHLAFPMLGDGGKYSIQIVNSSTGDVIKTNASISTSGTDDLGNVTWSPDGRYIAAVYPNYAPSSTEDESRSSILFWDAGSGALIQTQDISDNGDPKTFKSLDLYSLLWSPDSKYVVTTFRTTIGAGTWGQSFVSYVRVFNAPGPDSLG